MTTIEDRLRAAAQAVAEAIPAGSAPPLRLDATAGGSRPAGARRSRPGAPRMGRVVAPLAAAAAVVAVIAIATSLGAGERPSAPGERGSLVAPRQFSPLVPFASFGWLPGGSSQPVDGITSAHSQLVVGRGRSPAQLMTYPAGACSLTTSTLACGAPPGSPGAGETTRIDRRGPDLHGRPAYWVTGPSFIGGPATDTAEHFLAFQYAPGGWALAGYPSRADTVRIARAAQFGLTAPIRFGMQLQRAPSQWQVSVFDYTWYDSQLRGADLTVGGASEPADSMKAGYPWISAVPAGANPEQGCVVIGRHSTRVINGYRVTVDNSQVVTLTDGAREPEQDVCANDADGLLVRVSVAGAHPKLTAVQVFARLKLYGPDPSHWTTKPLG